MGSYTNPLSVHDYDLRQMFKQAPTWLLDEQDHAAIEKYTDKYFNIVAPWFLEGPLYWLLSQLTYKDCVRIARDNGRSGCEGKRFAIAEAYAIVAVIAVNSPLDPEAFLKEVTT